MEIEVNGITVRGDTSELKDLVLELAGSKSKSEPTLKPQTEPTQTRQNHHRELPVNFDSAYYRNGNGKKRFRSVAVVYDYIAAYQRGRTTAQIAEHFGLTKNTVWSTCSTLTKEGLIYQPGDRGTAWIAVPEQLAQQKFEPEPEPAMQSTAQPQPHPNPAMMPYHPAFHRDAM
jgi:hypothetical protein